MPKLNPRRIPRTQADHDKAEQHGRLQGMEFMLYLILFILQDKHGGTHEEIKQLGKEVNDYCELINKGEIKLRDVKLALEEEYDLTVRV